MFPFGWLWKLHSLVETLAASVRPCPQWGCVQPGTWDTTRVPSTQMGFDSRNQGDLTGGGTVLLLVWAVPCSFLLPCHDLSLTPGALACERWLRLCACKLSPCLEDTLTTSFTPNTHVYNIREASCRDAWHLPITYTEVQVMMRKPGFWN